MKMFESDREKLKGEKEKSFVRWFFHKLFHNGTTKSYFIIFLICLEVLYLSTLKSLWVDKTPPNPISLSETADELDENFVHVSPFFESYINNAVIPDQRVWGPKGMLLKQKNSWTAEEKNEWKLTSLENALRFLQSAKTLHELNTREKWEKDNQTHLDFVLDCFFIYFLFFSYYFQVTAAANLRACVFHLDLSSRFYVKEQAGNIIPAIATTNAIAAGMPLL